MCLDSLLGGGSKSAERQNEIQFNITRDDALRREQEAKAEEVARQDRIRQGQNGIDSAFAGFDDGYFDNYRNQYNEYYTPKLKEQYDQAKQDLTYGLAGKGLTQSSIGAKLFGDLQKKFDDANLQIGSQASDAARSLRGNIESNKNDLYALNQSSADPSAISTRAAASSRALTAAPTFTPLGDVFGSALGAAASALQADRKSLAPQIASPNVFNGGGKSSGRVVA